nr:hypothetical protein Iba_scaffold34020CG0800 [Ipomoea batatas]GME01520.1 hypothetical protein Iba_scaffold1678075CG0010 [Ipomoea batatas]
MSALRGSQPSMASPATEESQAGQPAATNSPSVNLLATLTPNEASLFLEFSFFNTVKFPDCRREPAEEENPAPAGSSGLSFSGSSLETRSPDLTLSKPDNNCDDDEDDRDLFPAAPFRAPEKESRRGKTSERACLELTHPITTTTIPQNP